MKSPSLSLQISITPLRTPRGPFGDDYLTLDADQLNVQQSITLTDGDGDTTNATAADLGGNFQISDDKTSSLHHR